LLQYVVDKLVNSGRDVGDPRSFAGGAAGFVQGQPLTQGQEAKYPIKVLTKVGIKNPPFNFKVTIVWSDQEGDLLQNYLDLIVTAGSTERHGNMGTASGFDPANNVKQVVWKGLPTGDLVFKVKAFRILVPQAYALVWRFY
jgi:serine protease AprX